MSMSERLADKLAAYTGRSGLTRHARDQFLKEMLAFEAAQEKLTTFQQQPPMNQMVSYPSGPQWPTTTTTTSGGTTSITLPVMFPQGAQGGLLGPLAAPVPPAKPLPKALVAGPIIGWRLWRVNDRRLLSLSNNTIWPPGIPVEANATVASQGTAGVYAMKTRDTLSCQGGWLGEFVVGEVALWGRVIEHSHGYRAEYAYPYRLHFPAPMPGFPRPQPLHDLVVAYGCDIVWDNSVVKT